MSNNPIRVVVADRPPLVFVNNASGTPVYSGMLIDLWQRVVAASNGTLGNYLIYTSPSNAGGLPNSAGVWNGVSGELHYNRADVALFPITRLAVRLEVIDATYSYMDEGLTVMVRNDIDNPGALSVLEPFATTLWLTLLFTVIGVALLFWALDAYGKWIRRKQAEALRASGAIPASAVKHVRGEGRSHMLISFVAAAGAPERPTRSSWGVQVLYVAYCFFCVIVLSAYTANLTSFLAVRRAAVGITGLADFAKRTSYIASNKGGITEAFFSFSKDTVAMQLRSQVRYCDIYTTCLGWLRAGQVDGYVADAALLYYLSSQQPCDLVTVGDTFGPGNLVIGLQKNSTLLPLINQLIQRFREDGTMDSLRRAWFDDLSQCSGDLVLGNSRLTIAQMIGAFVFLAMGILVAFVTGTVENLKWCLARAYKPPTHLPGGSQDGTVPDQDRSVFRRVSDAVMRAQRRNLARGNSLMGGASSAAAVPGGGSTLVGPGNTSCRGCPTCGRDFGPVGGFPAPPSVYSLGQHPIRVHGSLSNCGALSLASGDLKPVASSAQQPREPQSSDTQVLRLMSSFESVVNGGGGSGPGPGPGGVNGAAVVADAGTTAAAKVGTESLLRPPLSPSASTRTLALLQERRESVDSVPPWEPPVQPSSAVRQPYQHVAQDAGAVKQSLGSGPMGVNAHEERLQGPSRIILELPPTGADHFPAQGLGSGPRPAPPVQPPVQAGGQGGWPDTALSAAWNSTRDSPDGGSQSTPLRSKVVKMGLLRPGSGPDHPAGADPGGQAAARLLPEDGRSWGSESGRGAGEAIRSPPRSPSGTRVSPAPSAGTSRRFRSKWNDESAAPQRAAAMPSAAGAGLEKSGAEVPEQLSLGQSAGAARL